MRILILGVSGLIGHTLYRELSKTCEVYGILHKSKKAYDKVLFESANVIDNIDVEKFDLLKEVVFDIKPDVILNCIGITRRKINSGNIAEVISVNSCFPHKLALWAKDYSIRIIHFSTDCVFDGKTGNYSELSLTTARDLYGKTKALGELNYSHTLTIRSSFIGQELFDKTELLDWFLAQEGKSIQGFRNTLYSGVSTIFMTKVVRDIIFNFPNINGLYQLAPVCPISKYDLLSIARDEFQVNVEIIPDEEHKHYPTLDGTKLKQATGLTVPDWRYMMRELAQNRNDYK